MNRQGKIGKENSPWRSLDSQKVFAIAIAVLIVLALALYTLATLPEDFVFTEHLEDTVVTVRDLQMEGSGEASREDTTLVTLQELSYYIMQSEANVNRMAEVYNSKNTNQFWNIFTNHTFIKTKAKEVAFDSCVRDVIYCMEAKKAGMTLTEEEEAAISLRAQELADGLSLKQQETTRLTPEVLELVLKRIVLASKYANYLVDTVDFSDSEHMPEVEVECGGDYYESLKRGYQVEEAAFWAKVNLGKITIEPITS